MKHFEDEYKAYIDKNTPDLWDRIEKALPERQTAETEQAEPQVASKVIRYKAVWGIVSAAAGVCIILTAAEVMNLRQKSATEPEALGNTARIESASEPEAVGDADETESAAEIEAFTGNDAQAYPEYDYSEEMCMPYPEMTEEADMGVQVGGAAEDYMMAEPENDTAHEEEAYTSAVLPAESSPYFSITEDNFYMIKEDNPEWILNAEDYDLPLPADGEAVSVTIETMTCPWDPEKDLLFVGLRGQADQEVLVQLNLNFDSENIAGFRCISGEDPDEVFLEKDVSRGSKYAVLYEIEYVQEETADISAESGTEKIYNEVQTSLTDSTLAEILIDAAAVKNSRQSGDKTDNVSKAAEAAASMPDIIMNKK